MKLLENNFHRFITTLYAVQKYLTLRLATHIKSIYKEDNQHRTTEKFELWGGTGVITSVK